ncbi:MAG: protein kinase [Acidobacteriota bacterium]|nr:protein kinase [Acidobacteriota bacterium]
MTELLDIPKTEQPRENWYGLETGTVLAERYRVERLVSRGGMGAVFEATQLGLDRPVAVKVLLPSLSRDEKMQERFRREAQSAAALNHPNIIQIYDYGISDYGPYIVMEFVRGQSLQQILRNGPLTVAQSVNLMEQICSAIASAHATGIIHRDLKPDNIIVEEQASGTEFAKVLDFGIAKMREAQAEESDTNVSNLANLTGANIIGSPAYMSPEQSMGMDLDERSDVYALGIVLYEMLTGQTPFGKASVGAMLVHQVNTSPRSISQLRDEIPDAIEAVVMKALSKDRQFRFATATEFAQELRRAFDDPAEYATQMNLQATSALEDSFATNVVPMQSGMAGAAGAAGVVSSGALPAKQHRRLAILPLRNLAGDAEIDFLGFALADSVITQLAPLESLIVRPSSSVEKYRNQVAEPAIVGRDLQVDTILSGSYLKAGDMFRVTVQLIDVARNEILWQEVIDQKFDNVLKLQDKICAELIRGLKLNVTTNEQEALKHDEARNPMAYEFYLRGLAQGNTADGHKQAIEMLEASIGMDPRYAPAWAALAGRYINARGYLQNETLFGKAEIAARKAIELNPRFPAGFFWLAVYYGEKGDLKNALSVCKQLLQVAPNSEYAYQAMGHVYDYAGLPDIALTLFRKAAEINPVTFPYMIGFIQYQKGNYAEAHQELAACSDTRYEKYFWMAAIDLSEGRRDEAIQHLETLLEAGQTGIFFSSVRGLLLALRGETQEGKRILDEAFTSNLQLGSYHFYIAAEVYPQLGDTASAIKMLRQVVQTGYGNYPFLMNDPLLAPVREAEGFAEVARTMQELQTKLQLMLVTD